jgi:GR25 family glycosyltransferase involved in LPS biosynthesis
LNVIKDILKNNYQNCLILEDDCLINIDDFQYQLDKIINSNVKDIYDFIFIGNYTIHYINTFKKLMIFYILHNNLIQQMLIYVQIKE